MKNLIRYIFEGSLELPEEIKSLTNRSSSDEIDNAIALVLNLDDKMSPQDKLYAITNFKAKERTRHGFKFLSKSGQIAKIVDTFKQKIKDKEHAEAVKRHNEYLASPEGKKRKEEFDTAVEKEYEKIEVQKEEGIKKIKDILNAEVKFNVDAKFRNGESLVLFTGDKKSSVDINYSNSDWFSEKPLYKYKVQTTAYGAIEPDEPEAQAIILQGICLQNEKLIETIKTEMQALVDIENACRETLFNLKKDYKDLEIEK